jgi:hypothetical protein
LTTNLRHLIYAKISDSEGLFVGCGSNDADGNVIITSPNGGNWIKQLVSNSTTWYNLVYANNLFVILGSSLIATSSKVKAISFA